MPKKRVFNYEHYCKVYNNKREGWVAKELQAFEGKTKEECGLNGLFLHDDAFVEVPEWKPVSWVDDYDYGTTIVNRSEARVPFGMMLNVARRHDKWNWGFGNEYFVLSKGTCVSVERAKASAEQAFHNYVESNLALCREE